MRNLLKTYRKGVRQKRLRGQGRTQGVRPRASRPLSGFKAILGNLWVPNAVFFHLLMSVVLQRVERVYTMLKPVGWHVHVHRGFAPNSRCQLKGRSTHDGNSCEHAFEVSLSRFLSNLALENQSRDPKGGTLKSSKASCDMRNNKEPRCSRMLDRRQSLTLWPSSLYRLCKPCCRSKEKPISEVRCQSASSKGC